MSKTNFGFIGHKYGTFQKFKGENGIRAIKCIRSESFKASWLLIGSLEAKNWIFHFSLRQFRYAQKKTCPYTEVWKISNFPKKCFFASFWVKNEIFGEIWAFFEFFVQNLAHVNPLNTIRFWDFRDFSLRQRETLTAHIFGTRIAMDL